MAITSDVQELFDRYDMILSDKVLIIYLMQKNTEHMR